MSKKLATRALADLLKRTARLSNPSLYTLSARAPANARYKVKPRYKPKKHKISLKSVIFEPEETLPSGFAGPPRPPRRVVKSFQARDPGADPTLAELERLGITPASSYSISDLLKSGSGSGGRARRRSYPKTKKRKSGYY